MREQKLTDEREAEIRGKDAVLCPNQHCGYRQQVAQLRSVCAEAYQFAGAYDAPVEALDNLSAAANGKPLPHETFLPVENQWEKKVAQLETERDAALVALRGTDPFVYGEHTDSGLLALGQRLNEKDARIAALEAQLIAAQADSLRADLRLGVIEKLEVQLAEVAAERDATLADAEFLESEIGKHLRFERDEEDEWFVPAEPGPLGPFLLAEAVRQFMQLSDACNALDRKRIASLETQLAEAQARIKELGG